MTRTQIATFCAGLVKTAIKCLKKGRGEAAPGLIALKIDRDYIENRQKYIKNRIIVSGTNGKTTTSHLIGKILIEQDKKLITNPRGSNLSRGIAAALIASDRADAAVWETDEAAFGEICQQTRPTHIILLNLFRDQLDRYGEVDSTVKKWIGVLGHLDPATILINCDDPNLEYVARQCDQHRYIRFGIKENTQNSKNVPEAHGDAIFCPECGKQLCFSSVTFSHLGIYACSCGFKRGRPDIGFSSDGNDNITIDGRKISSKLEGRYSAYNITAAVTLSKDLGLDWDTAAKSIAAFTPSFGRQETMRVRGKEIKFLLIKNPTGASLNLEILQKQPKDHSLLIAINDKIADGRDVSWLWDTNFESLKDRKGEIIVTGTRCLDMAVRLKYAGLSDDQICIEPQVTQAVNKLLQSGSSIGYILPTYTAMGKIRQKLIQKQKQSVHTKVADKAMLAPVEPVLSPALSIIKNKQK